MATYHQERNAAGLRALWTPEPGRWKCISDKRGRMASCMSFDNEKDALAYCANTGDVLLPPPEGGAE